MRLTRLQASPLRWTAQGRDDRSMNLKRTGRDDCPDPFLVMLSWCDLANRALARGVEEVQVLRERRDLDPISALDPHVRHHARRQQRAAGEQVDENLVAKLLDNVDRHRD